MAILTFNSIVEVMLSSSKAITLYDLMKMKYYIFNSVIFDGQHYTLCSKILM